MSAHTLLLVDPDPDTLRQLTGLLGAPEWLIDTAANAAAAIAQLQAQPYDLVLVDLQTLDANGLEVLGRFRALAPDARIFVTTAESTPELVVGAIRARAFSYFSKPFSATALVEMLANATKPGSWQDDLQLLSAAPHWISGRVRCKLDTVDRLMQWVREIEADCPLDERENIASAFRELLVNAIEHGGRSDPKKWVQITYVRTARSIVYLIQDPGPGFSFNAIEHSALANPPDAPARHLEIRAEKGVRPGGFGILLTRKLVDDLIYNEKGNEVLFVKYLK